jgi:hypothetical protein
MTTRYSKIFKLKIALLSAQGGLRTLVGKIAWKSRGGVDKIAWKSRGGGDKIARKSRGGGLGNPGERVKN